MSDSKIDIFGDPNEGFSELCDIVYVHVNKATSRSNPNLIDFDQVEAWASEFFSDYRYYLTGTDVPLSILVKHTGCGHEKSTPPKEEEEVPKKRRGRHWNPYIYKEKKWTERFYTDLQRYVVAELCVFDEKHARWWMFHFSAVMTKSGKKHLYMYPRIDIRNKENLTDKIPIPMDSFGKERTRADVLEEMKQWGMHHYPKGRYSAGWFYDCGGEDYRKTYLECWNKSPTGTFMMVHYLHGAIQASDSGYGIILDGNTDRELPGIACQDMENFMAMRYADLYGRERLWREHMRGGIVNVGRGIITSVFLEDYYYRGIIVPAFDASKLPDGISILDALSISTDRMSAEDYNQHRFGFRFATPELEAYALELFAEAENPDLLSMLYLCLDDVAFNNLLTKSCSDVRTRYISFKDAGDNFSMLQQRKLIVDRLLKPKIVPEREEEDEVGYSFSSIYSPPVSPEDADGSTYLSEVDPVSCYCKGRTIFQELSDSTLLCVKLAKEWEKFSELRHEVEMIAKLSAEMDDIFPYLKGTTATLHAEDASSMKPEIKAMLDEQIVNSGYGYKIMKTVDEKYVYIVYTVQKPEGYGGKVTDFTVYLEEMSRKDYSADQIEEAYLRCLCQAAELYNRGYVHSSLINMFHSKERRFITTTNVVGMHTGRYGLGRMDRIFMTGKFSNFRLMGIVDFAEIMELSKFGTKIERELSGYASSYNESLNKEFYNNLEAIMCQFFSWVVNIIRNEFIANKNPDYTIDDKPRFTSFIREGFAQYMMVCFDMSRDDVETQIIRLGYTDDVFDQMVKEIDVFCSRQYVDMMVGKALMDVYPAGTTVAHHIMSDDKVTKFLKKFSVKSLAKIDEFGYGMGTGETMNSPLNQLMSMKVRGWRVAVFTDGEKAVRHTHIGWAYEHQLLTSRDYLEFVRAEIRKEKARVMSVEGFEEKCKKIYNKTYNANVEVEVVTEVMEEMMGDVDILTMSDSYEYRMTGTPQERYKRIVVIEVVRTLAIGMEIYNKYHYVSEEYFKRYRTKFLTPLVSKFKLGFQIDADCGELVFIHVGPEDDLDYLERKVIDTFYENQDAGAVNGAFPMQTIMNFAVDMFMFTLLNRSDTVEHDPYRDILMRMMHDATTIKSMHMRERIRSFKKGIPQYCDMTHFKISLELDATANFIYSLQHLHDMPEEYFLSLIEMMGSVFQWNSEGDVFFRHGHDSLFAESEFVWSGFGNFILVPACVSFIRTYVKEHPGIAMRMPILEKHLQAMHTAFTASLKSWDEQMKAIYDSVSEWKLDKINKDIIAAADTHNPDPPIPWRFGTAEYNPSRAKLLELKDTIESVMELENIKFGEETAGD